MTRPRTPATSTPTPTSTRTASPNVASSWPTTAKPSSPHGRTRTWMRWLRRPSFPESSHRVPPGGRGQPMAARASRTRHPCRPRAPISRSWKATPLTRRWRTIPATRPAPTGRSICWRTARATQTGWASVLWTSTNKGANFSLLNTNVPGGTCGISNVDRPMIKVNTSTHDLYVAGRIATGVGLFAAHSGNGGTSWDMCQVLDTNGQSGRHSHHARRGRVRDLGQYTNDSTYTWYHATQCGTPGSSRAATPGAAQRILGLRLTPPTRSLASGTLSGSTGTQTPTGFRPFPSRGPPSPTATSTWSIPTCRRTDSTTDQGDIFLAEAATNSDGSLTLTGPARHGQQ